MRLAFMGTPAFAVPALEALASAGHEVAAVYSQPPRRGDRGRVAPSPVQLAAERLGLTMRTPPNFKGEVDRAEWGALGLELAVVAAYGLILPGAILDAPRLGCFNIHASLLPRWRGAAPIQRAILAGDAETGVTIMGMERGLDTGPMWMAKATPIAHKTAGALTDELATMGAQMIVDVLARMDALAPVPQSEAGVTYAAKIDKAEARIDFARPAIEIERAVRAYNPSPGAWFIVGGERVKLLAAEVVDGAGAPGEVLDVALVIACGEGAIRPILVQRGGGRAMSTADLLRGLPVSPGTRL
jgi:methionyl-tRNA formyltransferase